MEDKQEIFDRLRANELDIREIKTDQEHMKESHEDFKKGLYAVEEKVESQSTLFVEKTAEVKESLTESLTENNKELSDIINANHMEISDKVGKIWLKVSTIVGFVTAFIAGIAFIAPKLFK